MEPEEQKALSYFGALALAGMIAGLGVLLASKEVLTLRIVLGRALTSTAMGLGAAAGLTLMPSMPFEAQIGLACLLASFGTSGLERLFQLWRSK